MASASKKAAVTKSILTPSMTLKGHGEWIPSISYFPDNQRMMSGSWDSTVRQWDLKEGKEIEGARDVCEKNVYYAVAVSRDGRWVVTGGGELKACEVETGIVKTFEGHSQEIYCIDISAENTLLIIARKKSAHRDILNSDATRRLPAGHHRPPIYAIPMAPRPPPTRDLQHPTFLRLSKFLRFSPRANAVPVRHIQPRDPLDVPATLPLPSPLSGQAITRFDHFETSSSPTRSNRVMQSLWQHLSFLVPKHSHGPPVIEVAPGRKVTRLVAAKIPEYKKVDDTRHPSSQ